MNTARRTSLWLANAGVVSAHPRGTYPKLENVKDTHYDAIVVGGGIFGCTTAYLLKESGKKVALIEARNVGGGTTGFSTAKLSAQQGTVYSLIKKKHDSATARQYYDMNIFGIRKIEELVTTLNLDCEFERRAHATFACDEKSASKVQKEFETCTAIGIENCRLVDANELKKELPPSVGAKLAVWFDDQAQFNSYKFCIELCKKIHGDGCHVYEESRVDAVSDDRPHRVDLTTLNSSITGDYVVLATHMPILDRSMHFAIIEPSRSLCIAVRVDNNNQTNRLRNMFISVDSQRSLRTCTNENEDIVVISGEGFKHGDETATDRLYENLEAWARTHFRVVEILYHWSAMDYYSADHIPFMGYLKRGTDTLFTATGFSKWGLANAAAGAYLVRDLIDGRENPWMHMVDARRWDLCTQFKGLAMENWHTTKHFIGDKIAHLLAPGELAALRQGEGGVVKVHGKTVGAYLDDNGGYHFVKPVCTHLGCDLLFNKGDRVWDCPCHGSQFDVDGTVIHGPACKSLTVYTDLTW